MNADEEFDAGVRLGQQLYHGGMVPTRCPHCDRYCGDACRSRLAQIEAERGWRETRVERLRALAGRPEGLSDQQAEELDYNDGVRFGLDMALTVLRGGSIEGRRFGG